MRIREKTIVTLMMAVAASCMTQVVSAYDIEIDGVCYTISPFNTLRVTSRENIENADPYWGGQSLISSYTGEITIPEKIYLEEYDEEYTVTFIAPKAFYKSSVTKLNLPSTIIGIGSYAFAGCSDLKDINLQSCQLQMINNYAFSNCTSLGEIIMPSTLREINDGAFSGAHIEKLCLNNVRVIGDGEFFDLIDGPGGFSVGVFCGSKIGSLDMGNLAEIGSGAFCRAAIGEIKWSDNLHKISKYAFSETVLENLLLSPEVDTESGAFDRIKVTGSITCMAEDPEAMELDKIGLFSRYYTPRIDFESVILYVPEQSIDSYYATEPWSGFDHIYPIGYDPVTRIDTPVGSKSSVKASAGIYDLLGRKVDAPTRGLYIIDGRKTLLR